MGSGAAVILVEYLSGGLVAQRANEAAARGFVPVIADNSGGYEGQGIVVETGANVGFGRGCNAAVRAVPDDVDVLVFQNPDATVSEEDLALLIGAVRDGWDAVAPTLDADRMRRDGFRVPTTRREGTLVLAECLMARGLRVPKVGASGPDSGSPPLCGPEQKPGRFASAALLVTSRAAFESIGGFDEDFFLYAEDLDLWTRLEKAGGRIGFLPQAVARHASAGGSDLAVERRIVMRWVGRELFAAKTGHNWALHRVLHLCGWLLLPNKADQQMRRIRHLMMRRSPRDVQLGVHRLMSGEHPSDAPAVIRVGWSRTSVPICPGGLVLDVGSGSFPNARADVLCERELVREHRTAVTDRPTVVADALALPFRAGAFDFVVASHLAEHVDDPRRFAAELTHVAHSGYIETPSPLFERLFPTANHRWIVRRTGESRLLFQPNVRSQGVVERLGDLLYPWYFAGTSRERPVIEAGGLSGRLLRMVARIARALATRSGATVTRVTFNDASPMVVCVRPDSVGSQFGHDGLVARER